MGCESCDGFDEDYRYQATFKVDYLYKVIDLKYENASLTVLVENDVYCEDIERYYKMGRDKLKFDIFALDGIITKAQLLSINKKLPKHAITVVSTRKDGSVRLTSDTLLILYLKVCKIGYKHFEFVLSNKESINL